MLALVDGDLEGLSIGERGCYSVEMIIGRESEET
jgi:hypothetical protein